MKISRLLAISCYFYQFYIIKSKSLSFLFASHLVSNNILKWLTLLAPVRYFAVRFLRTIHSVSCYSTLVLLTPLSHHDHSVNFPHDFIGETSVNHHHHDQFDRTVLSTTASIRISRTRWLSRWWRWWWQEKLFLFLQCMSWIVEINQIFELKLFAWNSFDDFPDNKLISSSMTQLFQYLEPIPEYEYLTNSTSSLSLNLSSELEMLRSGSSNSELELEWSVLCQEGSLHCWDYSGECEGLTWSQPSL